MSLTMKMPRRAALAGAALALALGAPVTGRGQSANRTLRIGILAGDTVAPHEERALLDALREQGFVEGRNLVVQRGYAEGRVWEVPDVARRFLAQNVDVVITTCTPTTRAAQQVLGTSTASTPIVMAAVADPVGQGLIASLSRPGANVTGRSSQAEDLIAKKLDLFAQVLGRPMTVAVLVDSNSAVHPRMFDMLVPAARQWKLELLRVESGRRPSDVQLPAAFATAVRGGAGAVIVLPDEPFFFARRAEIVALAASHRLPDFYGLREFVDAGGLISYGESMVDSYRSVAAYVGKIAAGAKPGDLPVAQPAQFELVINLKTARTLGVSVPDSVLATAAELIE